MNDKKSDAEILKILKENLPLNETSKAEVFRDRDRDMSDLFYETNLNPDEFESFIENKQKQRRYFGRPVDIRRDWKRRGWFKRYGIPELTLRAERKIRELSTTYQIKNWFVEKSYYFLFVLIFSLFFICYIYLPEINRLLSQLRCSSKIH